MKGRVKDAVTGQPLSNTVIHVKNVTAGRNDDILHDVTSGELSRLDVSKAEELVRQNVSWLINLDERLGIACSCLQKYKGDDFIFDLHKTKISLLDTLHIPIINPLKRNGISLYLKLQFVARCKHFSSRLQKPINLCCKWQKSLFVLR